MTPELEPLEPHPHSIRHARAPYNPQRSIGALARPAARMVCQSRRCSIGALAHLLCSDGQDAYPFAVRCANAALAHRAGLAQRLDMAPKFAVYDARIAPQRCRE